jgi:threonine dehydratase
MAQAVAWHARKRGLPCTVVTPETAPKTKLDAIRRLGADAIGVPVPTWFEVFRTRTYTGMEGVFVHPFSDPDVIAGNGTIGLEIVEDVPDVDAVLIPFGGGGLSCGIASALRALVPACRVYACEVETATPLEASLEAGEPVEVERSSRRGQARLRGFGREHRQLDPRDDHRREDALGRRRWHRMWREGGQQSSSSSAPGASLSTWGARCFRTGSSSCRRCRSTKRSPHSR